MVSPDDPTADRGSPAGTNRLERAIAVYIDYTRMPQKPDKEAFLVEHGDVRELLEPMFEDGERQPQEEVTDRTLGGFRLIRQIGSGGMGVVYEALQLDLGRRVALKILRSQLTLEPRALLRFKREATTIASLEHPGIVNVLAVGEEDDIHFFAMEFVDGAPLSRVVARVQKADPSTLSGSSIGETVVQETVRRADTEPTPVLDAEQFDRVWSKGYVETAVSIAIQVADALQHSHENGVIHRDVKPSNILVRRDGSVVLTDFGLARVDDMPGMTMTGEFAGSPHYIAPEQAMAKRLAVDHRADLFSLGATLYEMLTLQLAFPGETNQDVLARIISKDPVDPQKLNPKLAPDLAAIAMKALEKDPDRRYATAREFADDLRAFLAYRPVQARRISFGRRLLRSCKREPLRAALVAVLLIGVPTLLTLGGYVYAKSTSIEVGDRVQLEQEIERQLVAAFQQLHEGIPARAAVQFSKILVEHPEVLEARIGRVLAWLNSGKKGAERALAEVESDDPAVARVRPLVRERLRRAADEPTADSASPEVPPPTSAVDYFLAGMVALERGEHGDREAFSEVYELLSQALMRSKRVRRHYLSELTHVAGHLRDPVLVKRHAAAFEARWPGEKSTRMVVALATARVDPVRSETVGRALLQEEPDSHTAWFTVGRALTAQRRYAEATECFRKAIAQRDSPQVREGLAHALAMQGQFDAALAEFRYVHERRPKRINALVGIADMYIQKFDFEPALEWAERAYALAPKEPAVLRVLGIARHKSGDHLAAEELLQEARTGSPDSGEILTALAMVRNSLGKHRESIELCKKAMVLEPWHAEPWLRMGHAYALLEDYDEALSCYDEAIERDAELAVAHLGRGTALRFLGKPQLARTALETAAARNPTSALPHAQLGIVLEELREVGPAKAAYRQAIELDSKDWLSMTRLARLLQIDREFEAALRLLRDAIALRPNDGEVHLNLAVAHDFLKQSDSARTHFEKAVKLLPGSDRCAYSLGAFYFRQAEREAALKCFQRAVELNPENEMAQVNAGQILLGTGRYGEALPYLEKAHALAGDRPGWRYPTAKWIEMAKQRAKKE